LAKARCVFVMTKTEARPNAGYPQVAVRVGRFNPRTTVMKTKTNRGGAPQKTDAEKRERMVQVRFRQDEFDRLEQRRATTTARDLSSFIRSVCLEKPLLLKTPSETNTDILLSLLREMRDDILRIGSNVNQSARRINSTTDYHDLQRDVNQMTANIGTLDAQIEYLMGVISATVQPQTNELLTNDYPDK
jgi:hypothetical protein